MAPDERARRRSKVERVVERYDLDGFGEELERRWTGVDGERTSLRDLADVLNRAILEAALGDADRSTSAVDVRSAYRALSHDDVSRAARVRKERDLEEAGIDVDALASDFVSHQAVHTFLTEVRSAEYADSTDGLAEKQVETLRRLRGRTAAVTDSALDRLVRAGELSDGEYDVIVDVTVLCEDCGRTHEASDVILRGGCDCSD